MTAILSELKQIVAAKIYGIERHAAGWLKCAGDVTKDFRY